MDPELIEQNVHRLLGAMTGAATTAMVAVGDKLGLYRALAYGGPATHDELAARTGTAARYLREWLSQQVAAGFLTYREGDGRYVLPAEAAAVLAHEASPAFLAGGATITRGWFAGIDRLAEAFRTGAGIPWHEQDPAVFDGTERFFRPGYTASLTTEWIPALPGVADRLAAGQRRDPLGGEAGGVAGAKEPLGAVEDSRVLLLPGDAVAGAERLGETVDAREPAASDGGAAGQEGRRCLMGEHRGGLGRQRVPPVALPVGEESGGGLLGEPLPQVACRRAGAGGQFVLGSRDRK